MMIDVMLDLETMDTSSNAAIVSIGAVFFDSNQLGEKFYRAIDLQSCINAGLTINGDTIEWWMSQSDNARKALYNGPLPLKHALLDFSSYLYLQSSGRVDNIRIWGNGSSFDNAILANAYHKIGMPQPWKFWNDRCFRTLKALHYNCAVTRTGDHHNALDDAVTQANFIIKNGIFFS